MKTKMINIISQGGLLSVGALSVYLAYKYFNNKIESNKVKKPINHRFFINIKNNREFKIPSIILHHHNKIAIARTKVFQDMLSIKFKIWEEKIREAVNTQGDLNCIYQNTLIDIYHTYLKEWKEKDIPLIVVEKFNKWHADLIKLYQTAIENICNSSGYSSRTEKENAILEISNAMVVFTILDGEKTLGSINGELTGIIYKGITAI